MKIIESMHKNIKKAVVATIYEVIEHNPEKNINRIFSLARMLAKDDDSKKSIEEIEKYYNEVPSIKQFLQEVLTNTNKAFMKKLFENFFINAIWDGTLKRKKWLEKEDTKIPFVLLISPSIKCNLRYIGCYEVDYDKSKELSYEDIDKVVGQARDLGIYFIMVLGAEPFSVNYMWEIYEKYSDIEFMTFTNGTLITKEVADKIVKLGNIIPMLYLDGFEKETDSKGGSGTFLKVMKGMDFLKDRGVFFGVSSVVSRSNVEKVTSDEFIEMLINKGARVGWYFMYMPVGSKSNIELMLTPSQRIELSRRIKTIRMSKPYVSIDFFNDAPYVGGCIDGEYYCIKSKGDVESCIFAHIAVDNGELPPR
ncbi:radical SAM protein [Clostridium polyendosporum]|uniref:Radical SAM protein n=1 Tax=Clostridium polyendosporum TaxID=69208 RepID=A0A919VEX2_9CLOT|nr:radical SAM protein [Clostridium polyendosporum]GIM29639.1 radical SAM protein [Clostridium polyendosporum]